jgi:biotin transporter BioY
VIYTIGAGYLYVLKNLIMGDAPISLAKAIKFGALVFIPGDTLWCVFAAFLGKRLTKEIPLL